ncbi:hypothetical protein N0V87_009887 [Didymella glomerata]|uniref:Uncharacterized protein n=1 Tax=Didymella glomerata TaxID=749621 RepID=A0A9W9BUS1_9PLEO|nr:hypothetical protein N0V87_009887 [Didymella glomerata]
MPVIRFTVKEIKDFGHRHEDPTGHVQKFVTTLQRAGSDKAKNARGMQGLNGPPNSDDESVE